MDVYADFYKYLYQSAKRYLEETLVGNMGELLWSSFENEVDFVLTHPNGWGGAQQDAMRRAAVQAGLVSGRDAHSRITFLTEGEASMHFCVSRDEYTDEIKVRWLIVILS